MVNEPSPLLTVIVPSIGRPSIDRTIHSILAQTVPVQFVIASDVERDGAGPTMNRAASIAKTPYVGFVADDDRLDTHYAEWFAEENDGADLFIFRMTFDNGGVLPASLDPADLYHGGVGGSFIMRTDLLAEIPFIREEIPSIHEDWEMVLAVREAGHKIQVSERVAYFIRH